MGILNITSESFYDGGKYLSIDRACEQAYCLIAQGADLIDIGGESTRPGAAQVPLDIELSRIIPVINELRKNTDVCISVDTNKPEVMKQAVIAGANVINDIYALRKEGAMEMVAALDVPVCLMHMQGDPQTMQLNPFYSDGVITEVNEFFSERIDACLRAGIKREQLIIDPGFGFGKLVSDNLKLMYHLRNFSAWDLPVLLGVSRKSTIGAVLKKEVDQRLIGGIALSVFASLHGVAILRTHDVDETQQALAMIEAIHQHEE